MSVVRPGAAPRVSVVLSTFNDEDTIEEAAGSILDQTYRDLELVVVDDASTDGTASRVAAIGDPRLRLLRNERNLGVSRSANRGLAESRGELIARMDGDDVSLPDRIAREVAYLDAHPEVGLVGTQAILTRPDRSRRKIRPRSPLPPECLRARFVLGMALINPTTLMRRSLVDRLDEWYDADLIGGEDGDFALRLALLAPVGMVAEPLLIYRQRASTERKNVDGRRRASSDRAARKRIDAFLGGASDDDLRVIDAIRCRAGAHATRGDVLAFTHRLVERARELDFASPAAMAAAVLRSVYQRYRMDRGAEWFGAARDIARGYRVPFEWVPGIDRRRWFTARLRHLFR